MRLILQHILPKGFRRARNYGFLHPNSKRLITLLQLQLKVVLKPALARARPVILCACCGGVKRIVRTRIDMRQRQKPVEDIDQAPSAVDRKTRM